MQEGKRLKEAMLYNVRARHVIVESIQYTRSLGLGII